MGGGRIRTPLYLLNYAWALPLRWSNVTWNPRFLRLRGGPGLRGRAEAVEWGESRFWNRADLGSSPDCATEQMSDLG